MGTGLAALKVLAVVWHGSGTGVEGRALLVIVTSHWWIFISPMMQDEVVSGSGGWLGRSGWALALGIDTPLCARDGRENSPKRIGSDSIAGQY